MEVIHHHHHHQHSSTPIPSFIHYQLSILHLYISYQAHWSALITQDDISSNHDTHAQQDLWAGCHQLVHLHVALLGILLVCRATGHSGGWCAKGSRGGAGCENARVHFLQSFGRLPLPRGGCNSGVYCRACRDYQDSWVLVTSICKAQGRVLVLVITSTTMSTSISSGDLKTRRKYSWVLVRNKKIYSGLVWTVFEVINSGGAEIEIV